MNTATKWAIVIGGSLLAVLILIGLIVLLIKFFMKRCQKKAWDDISSLPKNFDTSISRQPRRSSSEREPLYPTTASNTLETPDVHVVIPIGENDYTKQPQHTLVQIQRDRLNRLKEEENRLRPMMCLSHGEDDIQREIDQAQKEFEESV
jgi:hypothetical protein